MIVAIEVCICIVVFGIDFSSQNRSSKVKMKFWLVVRFKWGLRR